jgi:hypothetical protein
MTQEQQAVVALDARWIVDELEGRDRPGLDARASQQILTNQRSVVARPCADQKDARAAGEARYCRRRWRIPQKFLQRIRLRLNGLFEKRAGRFQAASSQALRN